MVLLILLEVDFQSRFKVFAAIADIWETGLRCTPPFSELTRRSEKIHTGFLFICLYYAAYCHDPHQDRVYTMGLQSLRDRHFYALGRDLCGIGVEVIGAAGSTMDNNTFGSR